VPQQFLSRADVVACFEQMRGKGVAQRMATHFFADSGPQSRIFHRLLDRAFMNMVPPHLPAAEIHRQAFGWKHVLPDPFPALPFVNARALNKIGKKSLDIFCRTIPQFLLRHKINKSLTPFDKKVRTFRPHPVLLQASLKGIPKSLNRHRLVCIFFGHNSQPFQIVTDPSAHGDRQKKYITEHGCLATY